jgi:phosphate transport system substrate-binding protein
LAATAVLEGDRLLWAQTPNPLEGVEIPTSLEPGSELTIESSEAMRLVNEALRSRFSSQYGDAQVDVEYDSANNALQALTDGDADLAAIGRSLTEEEASAGLQEVPVSRNKIAILVSPSNPFAGSLTVEQFAQIFRGEITNWSEVGGQDAPIALVDQPADSDTRQAFRNYPVFESGVFESAPGATVLSEASVATIAENLDENSISYVVAEQALNNPAVKIVPMHDTLPDDERYPFSQPLSYVYSPETASPAVLAFLGFAVNPNSEALIEAARNAAIADGGATDTETAPGEAATDPAAEATPGAETEATSETAPEASPETTLDETAPVTTAPGPARGLPWWPWLLALPVLGGLLWWLLKDRAPIAAPLAAAADRRIILTPRNCRDAYAYWELPEGEVEALRQQNCSLALKLHDVTDIADVDRQAPHHTYQFDCDTVAVGDRHLPVSVDDRDYLVELGYVGTDNDWHALARSAHVRVPACPSSVTPGGAGAAAAAAAGLGALGVGAAAIARPADTAAPARVILTPRDCRNAYAYWELPPSTVDDLKAGSRSLKARLYDVTEMPGSGNRLNSLQEFNAELLPQGDLQLPIAVDDRDYLVEVGYVDSNYQWQALAKSESVRVPACPTNGAAAAAVNGTILGAPLGGAAGLVGDRPPEPAEVSSIAETSLTGLAGGVAAAGLGATLWSRTAAPAADPVQEPAVGIGRRTDMGAESKIILVPRGADAAYAYWEAAQVHKEALRQEGGRVMALRIHDATNLELDYQPPHATQEYILEESDPDHHVAIWTPDRDYVAELGYLTDDGQWLQLVRSLHVRVPAA